MELNELRKFYLLSLRRLLYLSDKEFCHIPEDERDVALSIMDLDGRPLSFEVWVVKMNKTMDEVKTSAAIVVPKTDNPFTLATTLLSACVKRTESKKHV